MTYRVTRLTCTQCNAEKRVRIMLIGDIEVYPRCHECGGLDWSEDKPKISSAKDEFTAFMDEFGRRQSQYLRKQFDVWREDRMAKRQADDAGFDAALGAMFRELWDILESPE